MSRATPRTFALRFRIWQYAAPREWDVTLAEIAEALNEDISTISGTVANAGWSSRLRRSSAHPVEFHLGFGSLGGGQRAAERFITRDVLAGRVEAGTL